MNNTKVLRDGFIEHLKGTGKEIALVKIDGHYFSAVDVAIKEENGKSIDMYRMVIVKKHCQNQQ